MSEITPMDEALKLLSRQAYSESQLHVKLGKLGFDEEAIIHCLLRLKTWGYLNDCVYGEERIRLLQNRFKSREYVRYDLEGHGFTAAFTEELLNRFYPPEAEVAIARKLLGKGRGRPINPSGTAEPGEEPRMKPAAVRLAVTRESDKAVAKAAASLARAGFAEETIRRCFSGEIPAISST